MASSGVCVDSHFHIWDLNKFKYPWPTHQDGVLYTNFTADEYQQNMKQTPVKYAVFIQVLNNTPEEANWVLEYSKQFNFIKGIVAGLDLTNPKLGETVDHLRTHPEFVGVRHILDFEKEDWITRPDVHRGLAILQERGLTYDLLVRLVYFKRELLHKIHYSRMSEVPGLASNFKQAYFKREVLSEAWRRDTPASRESSMTFKRDFIHMIYWPHHLKYVPAVISKFPELKIVVDHIAKPYIKDQIIDGWREAMAQIATFPNVYCKVSGLVSEADPRDWKPDDIRPYVKHILDIFGVDRCMFGSDWPVCTAFNATYKQVYELARSFVDHLPSTDQDKIFGLNAAKFYNLKI